MFWALNPKVSKILVSHFVERVILHLLVFVGCILLLKFYNPEAFECWPLFTSKTHDMTSLKPHFLKNFLTDFTEI